MKEVLSIFTFGIGALCFASGRSNDGVKKTCARRKTLTIAGFALDGKRAAISEVCSGRKVSHSVI